MTVIVQNYLSHAKNAESADYLFINVIALIHTEGQLYRTQNPQKAQNIRDLGIRFPLNNSNWFGLFQGKLIWDIVPGAMHLKSLRQSFCLSSC